MARRQIVYRDPFTGRFSARGNIHVDPEGRRLQRRSVRDDVTIARRPLPSPRHPATGRFITKAQAKTLKKKRITTADVRKIIELSPKMQKRIRDARERHRRDPKFASGRRVRFIIEKQLRQSLRKVRRGGK